MAFKLSNVKGGNILEDIILLPMMVSDVTDDYAKRMSIGQGNFFGGADMFSSNSGYSGGRGATGRYTGDMFQNNGGLTNTNNGNNTNNTNGSMNNDEMLRAKDLRSLANSNNKNNTAGQNNKSDIANMANGYGNKSNANKMADEAMLNASKIAQNATSNRESDNMEGGQNRAIMGNVRSNGQNTVVTDGDAIREYDDRTLSAMAGNGTATDVDGNSLGIQPNGSELGYDENGVEQHISMANVESDFEGEDLPRLQQEEIDRLNDIDDDNVYYKELLENTDDGAMVALGNATNIEDLDMEEMKELGLTKEHDGVDVVDYDKVRDNINLDNKEPSREDFENDELYQEALKKFRTTERANDMFVTGANQVREAISAGKLTSSIRRDKNEQLPNVAEGMKDCADNNSSERRSIYDKMGEKVDRVNEEYGLNPDVTKNQGDILVKPPLNKDMREDQTAEIPADKIMDKKTLNERLRNAGSHVASGMKTAATSYVAAGATVATKAVVKSATMHAHDFAIKSAVKTAQFGKQAVAMGWNNTIGRGFGVANNPQSRLHMDGQLKNQSLIDRQAKKLYSNMSKEQREDYRRMSIHERQDYLNDGRGGYRETLRTKAGNAASAIKQQKSRNEEIINKASDSVNKMREKRAIKRT